MMSSAALRRTGVITVAVVAMVASTSLQAWGTQGHRVIALLATNDLTPIVRQNVEWLLDKVALADEAMWADDYRAANGQTALWHYVDIPSEAAAYDRNRDCPKQPDIIGGIRTEDWRDCVVDRILYNEERLANRSLDRSDRAIALKFLVHFVADLHQPLHALAVANGGNDIPVVAFGSPMCMRSNGTSYPCNLHGVWDTTLIMHRQLTERQYVNALSQQIRAGGWDTLPAGAPAEWARESHDLAKAALLPPGGMVDDMYYRAQISVIDKRLALAGLRLAAMLNRSLATNPPAR
jgi:hypothetical protein